MGIAFLLLFAWDSTPAPARAQQVADTAFVQQVAAPVFSEGEGPLVLIDGAHNNFHTASGGYFAFAELLRADGYLVAGLDEPLTESVLEDAGVLVIANALADENREDWALPTPSAFTADEIEAVKAWVEQGGALFLIADHMPFPGAAADLAAAFGFEFENGFAFLRSDRGGTAIFRKDAGTLADHPVTRGSKKEESIPFAVSFTGQAFSIPEEATGILMLGPQYELMLPERAWEFDEHTPRKSAGGLVQGAVMTYGRGRLAVFGEAAMFTAQLAGPQRRPMGMNAPQAAHNKQFALNLMHWLSGQLLDSR